MESLIAGCNLGKASRPLRVWGIPSRRALGFNSRALRRRLVSLYIYGFQISERTLLMRNVHSQEASKLKVRVGEHDVSTLNEPIRHDEYDVASIVVHPKVWTSLAN